MLYPLFAKLLDYPSPQLQAARKDMQQYLQALPPNERSCIEQFINQVDWDNLLEWQALYVRTFDMIADNSLHLTHHLFGEEKNRGPALIDLHEFYQAYGLQLAANELPDYLPLMLEFAAQLEPQEARLFLSKWSKVLLQLALNLEKIESPYAAIIRLLEQRSYLAQAA